jgi:uncharacterized repeat protein (TIGR01451 family)
MSTRWLNIKRRWQGTGISRRVLTAAGVTVAVAATVVPVMLDATPAFAASTRDIAVTKTASASTANVGDDVTFTITAVRQSGGSGTDAAGTITDFLPAGLIYKSATPSPASAPAVNSTGPATIVWNSAIFNSGGNTQTFQVVATVAATGSITNTGTWTPNATTTDGTTSNNTSSVTITGVTTTLAIAKSMGWPSNDNAMTGSLDSNDSTEPLVGQTIGYTVTISRASGTADVSGISAVDTLPAGLEYVVGSATVSNGSTSYSTATRKLTWTGATLASGTSSITMTYFVVVTALGVQANSAALVTPAGPAPVSVSVNATPIVKNPDLSPRCRAFQVTLILDSSGSIQSPGNAVATVRTAAQSFLAGLNGTGSKANIVQFSELGQALVSSMTTIDNTSMATNTGVLYNGLFGTNGYYGSGAGNQNGGYTNWASGLNEAKNLYGANAAAAPDLVLFVTDGVPNKYNLSGTQGSDDTEARRSVSRNKAVAISNAMKLGPDGVAGTSDDIKFIGIGVGQIASSPSGSDSLWTRNILAVSGDSFVGPLTSNPSNVATNATQVTTATISTLDAIVFSDYGALGDVLKSIVSSLCNNTLTINKVIAGQPASGWTFNVTNFQLTAPGTATWLNSSGVSTGNINVPQSSTTGADGSTSFKWQITGGNTTTTGATITFNETQQAGYQLVNVTCNQGGSTLTTTASPVVVRVPNAGNVTCTVANQVIPSTLTLKKVVNQGTTGGTAATASWTLTATGPQTISGTNGSTPVTNRVVTAGNYVLSESTGPAGYTPSAWDCGPGRTSVSSVQINPGDNVTCTITNAAIPPRLTLTKVVINDDGGTASTSSFNLTATGPSTTLSGVSGSASVTNQNAAIGTWAIGESGPTTDYTRSIVCNGQTVASTFAITTLDSSNVCTITNNDIPKPFKIDVTPDTFTNGTGNSHTFTVTLTTGPVSGPITTPVVGATINLAWTGPAGSAISPLATTCVTNVSGQCLVTVTAPTNPGTGSLKATYDLPYQTVDSSSEPNQTSAPVTTRFDKISDTGAKTWKGWTVALDADSVNYANASHTFVATVNELDPTTGATAPATNGTKVAYSWTGSGTASPASPCIVSNGTCLITVFSATTGAGTLTLTQVAGSIAGQQATQSFTAIEPNLAKKTWIDYQLTVTPKNPENLISDPDHEFLVTLTGLGDTSAASLAGKQIGVTLTSALPSTATWIKSIDNPVTAFATGTRTATCTVTAAGTCKVVVTATKPGSATLTATYSGTISGVTRSFTDSGVKTWTLYGITVSPTDALNYVGTTHTVTVTITKDSGAGPQPVIGAVPSIVLTGQGSITSNLCTLGTVGPNGTCTVTIASTTPGTSRITATFNSTAADTTGSVPVTAFGDKTWAKFDLSITPSNATNLYPLDKTHGVTITLTSQPSSSALTAGQTLNIQLDSSVATITNVVSGSIVSTKSATCTTNANGQCFLEITATAPGTALISASFGKTIGGVNQSVPATATKTWEQYAINVTPPNADNYIGTTHTVTVTVTRDAGAGFQPVAGAKPTISLTGVGTITSNLCTAPATGTSASGTCTVTITSTTPGTSTVTAQYLAQSADTTGTLTLSGSGNKTWLDYSLTVSPGTATNLLPGDPKHLFLIKLTALPNSAAASGQTVGFTLDSTVSIITNVTVGSTTGPKQGTCITDNNGECIVEITGTAPGTATLNVSFVKTVPEQPQQGVTQISRTLNASAAKTYVTYSITIDPNTDDNLVSTNHVFTVTTKVNNGDGLGFVPKAGIIPTIQLSGPGTILSGGATCSTGTSATGTCTLTITSAVAGTTHVTASFGAVAASSPATQTFSASAVKNWVDYRLSLIGNPNPVNGIGQPHVFTFLLEKDTGGGFQFLPGTGPVTITATGTGSITNISPTGPSSGTCTTDAAGKCFITVLSTTPGSLSLTASYLGVAGATSKTVTATAVKTWVPSSLQITKKVTGFDGPWSFVFTLTGGPSSVTLPSTLSGVGSAATTGSWTDLQPGVYTLTETPVPGYATPSLTSCGSITLGSTFALTTGASLTCTITNPAKPSTITVTKTVDGFSSFFTSFVFELTGPGGTQRATATAVAPAVFAPVLPSSGTYTLKEVDVPVGYAAVSLVCTGDSNPSATIVGLVVTPGQNISCTADNHKLEGSLTLTKQVVNAVGPWSFDFTVVNLTQATTPTTVTLTNTAPSTILSPLRADDVYKVTEVAKPGYAAGNITCAPNSALATTGATVAIVADSNVSCTAVNTKLGSLTLTKAVEGASSTPATFTFTLTQVGGTGPSTRYITFPSPSTVSWTDLASGTYVLKEIDLDASYNAGLLVCGVPGVKATDGVTLNIAGQDISCTATNTQTSSISLTKVVAGLNGVLVPWSFEFTLDGPGGSSTRTVTSVSPSVSWLLLPPGVYKLSETKVASGYTAQTSALGCTGVTLGSTFTLVAGLPLTCTATNTVVNPPVKLVKATLGGTGTFRFTITGTIGVTTVDVSTNAPTIPSSAIKALVPGTYTVTEAVVGPDGATWETGQISCTSTDALGAVSSATGSFSLVPGGSAECSVLNKKRADLTVTKVVTGSSAPWTFQFTLTGPDGSSKTVSSTPAGANVAAWTNLRAGDYKLTETPVTGYGTPTTLSCTGVTLGSTFTINAGDKLTCTVVNPANPVIIDLTKTVNGYDGTDWQFAFAVNGDTKVTSASTPTVTWSLTAGSTFTVTETPVAGYNQGPITCTVDGHLIETSFNVPPGTHVVCVATNTAQLGKITVKKVVEGYADFFESFTFQLTGPGAGGATTQATATVVSSAVFSSVVPSSGTYTLTEVNIPAGYAPVDLTCGATSGSSGVTLTVKPGDDIVCTATNRKLAGSLKITKQVVNAVGPWSFDFSVVNLTQGSSPSTVTLTNTSTSTTLTPLRADDVYKVTEVAKAGYAAGNLTCGPNSALATTGATVAIVADSNVTCTAVNTKLGSLTLNKLVEGASSTPATFTFTLTRVGGTGPSTRVITFPSPSTVSWTDLASGTYVLKEINLDPTYFSGSLVCGPTGAKATDGVTLTIAGQDISCSATNTQSSSISLTKVVAGLNNVSVPWSFEFTLDGPGGSIVRTVTSSSPSVSWLLLPPGSYKLSETKVASGYAAQTSPLACTGVTLGSSFMLVAGLPLTCTATNTVINPPVKLVKTTEGGTGTFRFTIIGTLGSTTVDLSTNLPTNVSSAIKTLAPGSYTVSEAELGADGSTWEMGQIGCSSTDALGAVTSSTDSFSLVPGGSAECQVLNKKRADLTVTKVVTKSSAPWTFQFTLTGPDGSSKTVSSTPAGANVAAWTNLRAGQYKLTETPVPGYSTPVLDCNDGDVTLGSTFTINAGDELSCTVTNPANSVTIDLTKKVTGYDGDWAFAFAVNGDTKVTSASTPTVSWSLTAGSTFNVTETPVAGYDQGPITCKVGVTTVGTSFNVPPGTHVVCDATNVAQPGKITVNKVVRGYTDFFGTFTFELQGPGAGGATVQATATAVSSAVFFPVVPSSGVYTLKEINVPFGYAAVSLTCGGTSVSSGVTVKPGDDIVCTATNRKLEGSITLTKHVVNEVGPWSFDFTVVNLTQGSSPSTVTLTNTSPSTTFTNLTADDVYSIAEAPKAGYVAGELTCGANAAKATDGVTVAVVAGQPVECNATNTKLGSLSLVKLVEGVSSSPATFTFTLTQVGGSGPSTRVITFPSPSTVSWTDLASGTYVLKEINLDSSYFSGSLVCGNDAAKATDGVTLTIAGQEISCEATNTQTSSISLQKLVEGLNGVVVPWSFDFTLAGPGGAVAKTVTSSSPLVTWSDLLPGTYKLSETKLATGYTAQTSALDCTGVTLGSSFTLVAGSQLSCTATNTVINPPVQLVKVTTGGTGTFKFTITGTSGVTTVDVSTSAPTIPSSAIKALAPGTYTVTEEVVGPDGATWEMGQIACDSTDANGAVTSGVGQFSLVPGGSAACLVLNKKRADLTITKVVTGSDAPWSFQFTLTGPDGSSKTVSSTPAGANVAAWTNLRAGDYKLTETPVTGYGTPQTLDCGKVTLGSTFTINAGDKLSCTVVNPANPVSIELTKKVTGYDGDWEFAFAVNGDTKITSASTPTVSWSLTAGSTFTVTEAVRAGYDQGPITCKAGDTIVGTSFNVPPGTHVVCEATNIAQPGKITVNKVVRGYTDFFGSFTFALTGPGVGGATTQATATAVSSAVFFPVVPSSGVYTLTEVGIPAGYAAVSLTCGGTSVSSGITVNPGDDITCTATNRKLEGSITVTKHVDNAEGPWSFDFTVVGPTSSATVTLTDTAPSTTFTNLKADDVYTITEIGKPGYVAGDLTCGANAAKATDGVTVAVVAGQGVECTAVNTKLGSLTLTKRVVTVESSPATFTFTLNQVDGTYSSTKLIVFPSGSSTVSWTDLASGAYVLKEVDLGSAYIAGDLLCNVGDGIDVKATDGVTLTIAGQDIQCGATNIETGIVEVDKVVVNDTDSSSWSFGFTLTSSTGYTAHATASKASGGQPSPAIFTNVPPGNFTVTEDEPPAPYISQGVKCELEELKAGGFAECEATNLAEGKITVVKKTVGGRPGTFDFKLMTGQETVGSTTLVVTGPASASTTFTGLTPGQYSLAELANEEPGWGFREDLSSCTGLESPFDGSNAYFQLPSNGAITCTFVNERVDLKVDKTDSEAVQNADPTTGGLKPTEPVTYTIKVTNASSVNAVSTATLTDQIPSVLTWTAPSSFTPSAGITCAITAGLLTCAIAPDLLPAGGSVTIDVPAVVNANALAGVYTNVVVVDSPDDHCNKDSGNCTPPPGCINGDNADCETTTVARVIYVKADAACVENAPYVSYEVTANFDPTAPATLPISLTWSKTGSTTPSTTQTVASPDWAAGPNPGWFTASSTNGLLWPGTVIQDGKAVDWPGWDYVGGRWVYHSSGVTPFDGGDLRPQADVLFEVNPKALVVVEYPDNTEDCNANPPVTLKVVNETVGNQPGEFGFELSGTVPSTSFSLTNGASTTFSLLPGTYTVDETVFPNPTWRPAGEPVCSVVTPLVDGVAGDEGPFTLTLAQAILVAHAGDQITCTFVNETFDLEITKTHSPDTSFQPGDSFDWNVKVTNLGTGDAQSTATVTDFVPSPLVVSTLPAVCPSTSVFFGGTLVTCELPASALTAGASTTFTLHTTVPPLTLPGQYTNVAVVQTPGDCSVNSDNNCNPPPTCQEDDNELIGNGCVPPPNDCIEGQQPVDEQFVAARFEGDLTNNVACDTITVGPLPALSIDKLVSRSADHNAPDTDYARVFGYTVGTTAVYQYKVTNTGNVAVFDIVLGDDMVFGTTPITPSADRTGAPHEGDLTQCRVDNTVDHTNVTDHPFGDSFTFGEPIDVTLQPGDTLYLYCLLPISSQLVPNPAEAIYNKATVTGSWDDGEDEQLPVPVAESPQTRITFTGVVKNIITINPDGSFGFSPTDAIAWGSTVVYRMVVTNTTGGTLTNVRLFDYFSGSNLVHVADRVALFNQMKCIAFHDGDNLNTTVNGSEYFPGGALTWDLSDTNGSTQLARERLVDDLAPGDSYAIVCLLKLPTTPMLVTTPGGLLRLQNTFRVLADNLTPSVVPLENPEGGNPGPADIDNEATVGINTTPTCQELGNCSCVVLGNCPPPPCTVDCTPRSPNADLAIVKDASVATILPGGTFSYTLIVTNLGPDQADGVKVADQVPPQLTLLTATSTGSSCTTNGSTATCTRPVLTSGSTFAIKLEVRANGGLANGQVIHNVAVVTSTTPDSNPNNNSDDADVRVVIPPPPVVIPTNLPPTGSDPWVTARYAFVMLGVGGLVLLVSRRRKSAPASS